VQNPQGAKPRFRVTAEYPRGSELSVRRSRAFTIQNSDDSQ
jgi:hypothetical protein